VVLPEHVQPDRERGSQREADLLGVAPAGMPSDYVHDRPTLTGSIGH
jgi:hypothetical protein